MRSTAGFSASRACLIALAFAVCLGTPPASAQTPSELAPITFKHAEDLYEGAQYQQVVTLLDAYLADHPRDARAYVMRGDAKANLNRDEDALRDYNTALKIAPDYAYGYVTRCQTRLTRGDSSGALDDCNIAIRLDDTSSRAYENRGDVYFDRDQYALAVADFDAAIAKGDSSAYVYAARCDAERYVGKFAAAATDCDRALTINPKNLRGLWARARLELVRNDAVGAIADLNTYIAKQSHDSAAPHYWRGAAYNRVQKWSLALEDFDLYVKANPSDADGYVERGIARAELHQTANADGDFAAAIKLFRHDANDAGVERVNALIAAMHANGPLALPPL